MRSSSASWLERTVTIDVEGKAKELAVLRLQRWIKRTAVSHAA